MKVVEIFQSLQGEGLFAGLPAVFVRLAGCNLYCRWCDTKYAWSGGKEMTVDELLKEVLKYEDALKHGARLVITGGEPLLQQEDLVELVIKLSKHFKVTPAIEVETNGTIMPSPTLFDYEVRFNVSPKLSNSGVPLEKRLNRKALELFASYYYSVFKFVVASEDDVREIFDTYGFLVDMLSAERWRIMLMPLASTREEYLEIAPKIARLAIKYGFSFSPRFQVEFGFR